MENKTQKSSQQTQRPLTGRGCCRDAAKNASYNVHEEIVGTKSHRDGTCSRCGTNLRLPAGER